MIKVGFIARVEQWGLLGPVWPQPSSQESSRWEWDAREASTTPPLGLPLLLAPRGDPETFGGEARGMGGDEKENLSVRNWKRPSYRASL